MNNVLSQTVFHANTVASVIASDERLTDMFIQQVTARVDELVHIRQRRYLGIISLIIATLGLLVTIGFLGSFSNIQSKVSDAVLSEKPKIVQAVISDVMPNVTDKIRKSEESVDSRLALLNTRIADSEKSRHDELQAQAAEFERKMLYVNFALSALRLDVKDSIAPIDRDSVLVQLEQIAREQELLSRADFPFLLEHVIDAFNSAMQTKEVDQVVQLVQSHCERSEGICFTLVGHYGQRLVGEIGPTTSWNLQTVETFRRFENSALDKRIPLARMWRLLVDFKMADQQPDAATEKRLLAMRDSDRAEEVISWLICYSHVENFSNRRHERTVEVANVCDQFVQTYVQQIRDVIDSREAGRENLANELLRRAGNDDATLKRFSDRFNTIFEMNIPESDAPAAPVEQSAPAPDTEVSTPDA